MILFSLTLWMETQLLSVSSDLVFRSYLETDCVYKSHKYSPHRVLEVRLAPAVQEGRGFQGSPAHHLYLGALDFPKDRWRNAMNDFKSQISPTVQFVFISATQLQNCTASAKTTMITAISSIASQSTLNLIYSSK